MKKAGRYCILPVIVVAVGGLSYLVKRRVDRHRVDDTDVTPQFDLLNYYEALVKEHGEEKANASFYLGESL
ncbi:hypothetical protein [Rossellomorea marisflavi]|uniref:hypothetical protein n=1 Tax=Rossellomorea marisflavi TaxID=189381 RepID=UPI003FA0EFA3